MPRVIEAPPPRRPAYFWWLLANALALCFAVLSWTFCLDLFGYPERPRNHGILKKIGRLPELKRYTVLDVPNGNVRDPRMQYSWIMGRSADQLTLLNQQLIRNYLTNFDRPLVVTYIEGDYVIERVRALEPSDFISRGVVVRARARIRPDEFTEPAPYPVVIDYVFPTSEASVDDFRPGDILEVRKSPNCAAVIHADRMDGDDGPVVCLTAAPIAYGPYRAGDGISFVIEPPEEVNPGAPFPMFAP